MVWVMRLLPLVLLVSVFSFPALSLAETYGSGEVEFGKVRLQFPIQLSTAGTCQEKMPAYNIPGENIIIIQCQVPEGTHGTIQLMATRTPAGAVNIRASSLPPGWPAFPIASGWGTVTARYTFTVPSGSAGTRFELAFRAFTAGVVGEVERRVVIDSVRQPSLPPPAPTPTPPPYPPTEPVPPPPKTPRIEVVPERLDFGTVTVGEGVIGYFQIMNTGNALLRVTSITDPLLAFTTPFSVVGGPRATFSLPPGTSTYPFLVLFRSVEAGNFTAEVIVTSNDPQRPQVIIHLTGKALPKPEVSRPPEETPAEGEAVPKKDEVKKCAECPFGLLSQNCQLIPEVSDSTCPYRKERLAAIAKLVSGEWANRYHVICLQEVFSYAGKKFDYKNAIAREWLQDKTADLRQAGSWHLLGEIQRRTDRLGKLLGRSQIVSKDRQVTLDNEDVQLLGRNPAEGHDVQQIAVLKKGDRYLVAGPDSTATPRSTVDGGLMILSKYPVIAASGFTFYHQYGKGEGWSNKGALYARLLLDTKNRNLGCYVHVFNTHMGAGNEEDSGKGRGEQLAQLKEFISKCIADEQGNPDGRPVIICGDFNIDGFTGEYHKLTEWCNPLKLKDAWMQKNHYPQPPKSPLQDPRGDISVMGRAGNEQKRDAYNTWLKECKGYKKALEDYLKAQLEQIRNATTWVGKQDRSQEKNSENTPWGTRNLSAAEEGNYQRLDYIFYSEGSTPLNIVLESITREPAQKGEPVWEKVKEQKEGLLGLGMAKQIVLKGYTVSDHLGVGAQFQVRPTK